MAGSVGWAASSWPEAGDASPEDLDYITWSNRAFLTLLVCHFRAIRSVSELARPRHNDTESCVVIDSCHVLVKGELQTITKISPNALKQFTLLGFQHLLSL